MDDEGTDQVILEQMHQTRTALADKLETLENQVADTVQSAASAVAVTVEDVKEAVHDTVATVTDSVRAAATTVKESFDLRLQVERHPWAIMGASLAVGYLVERLFAGSGSAAFASAAREEKRIAHSANGGYCGPRTGLAELLGPEVERAKGLILGALLGSVRDTIVRAAPAAIRDGVAEIVDSITKKLGGEVVSTCAPATAE